MKNENKWAFDENSFAFNFFLQFIIYIICAVLTFLTGLIVSILCGDFTHLGRAGAVITLLAISMAYRDFYVDLRNMSFEEVVKFLGKEKLFEMWASSFIHKKKDRLEKIKPGFNEKDALEFLDKMNSVDGLNKYGEDAFIKAWLKEMLDIWSKKLRGWEFKMLGLGTFLWAFSDLINNFLG
ncbi:hypothetical protein [Marinomonas posidonica]|uniref:hypothetical protein n=1 Tax=Marinomonas posidonica TaxID=936476 RepID=UPI003736D1BB